MKVDEADRGLNPLGLAKGVVPFDIDPSFLDVGSTIQGQTHFEQVFQRAEKSFGNAVSTFNHANLLTELIRRTQDSSDTIYANNYDQEIDYKNRLIEIYGYPYDADIGPAGTYPSNYDGPDCLPLHVRRSDRSDRRPGRRGAGLHCRLQPAAGGHRLLRLRSARQRPALHLRGRSFGLLARRRAGDDDGRLVQLRRAEPVECDRRSAGRRRLLLPGQAAGMGELATPGAGQLSRASCPTCCSR